MTDEEKRAAALNAAIAYANMKLNTLKVTGVKTLEQSNFIDKDVKVESVGGIEDIRAATLNFIEFFETGKWK